MKYYKFLNLENNKIKSDVGEEIWQIGKWKKLDGELKMCEYGFHCSRTPYQAFSYVQGNALAIVETRGKALQGEDKECWSEMRIVRAYKWTKKDSVALAIYAAELVLPNFEKEYPDDKRPREAIEAAKRVLFKDNKKNREAAESAAGSAWSAAWSAAGSAWSAAGSAKSAAGSAKSAARSARSAARSAWSAARSARSAARSARSAAWSAVWEALYQKLADWMIKHIGELKEIK